MKKKIEYINIDASLAKWLIENLPSSELKNGIYSLISDEVSTLMIEGGTNENQLNDLAVIRCKDITINNRLRRVEINNNEVTLTPKEYDILYFLARNRGEIFTKEQIYNAVWDGEYVMDDSNIMAFIRKLRKKIEPNPDDPEYILTIWGIGYKFNDKI